MKTTIAKLLTACSMCFAFTVHAETVTPSDAEIVGILAAADNGEIQSAELAAQRAAHPEIKQFAQHMLTEHTAMSQESRKLADKLGLKRKDSATSRMLTRKSEADLKKLKELQAAEFDKEYVGDQVLMHKLVLETIENVLIRSADNAELKAMLAQARGKVAAHLEQARRLKAKYDK